jgi:hypothetical protein
MIQMFYHASVFNQSVTIMAGMFSGAGEFNQRIGSWVVSGVTGMEGMFIGSAGEFNRSIGLFRRKLTKMVEKASQKANNREQPQQYWNQ